MAARKRRLQGRTFVTTVLALASVATFSASSTVNKGILRAQRQTGLGKVTESQIRVNGVRIPTQ